VKPSAWTFLARGAEQLKKHGPRLLWLRFVRRKAILQTSPLPCPDSASLEVHTQVCARDWLNALWTLKSFGFAARQPFRLLVLCDRTVPPEAFECFSTHFPGSRVIACDRPSTETREAFTDRFPDLFALRDDGRFFTLPKVMDSYAHRRGEMILTIDPDVLFFAEPIEMLADLDPARDYFACLNEPRRTSDAKGTFAIDAASLRAQFGIELPVRFNCGLGSMNYARMDWGFIQRVLVAVPPDPERAFMLDQTIIALASLTKGWKALPPERYAIEPVESLNGVVARHYYSKTRDLLYLEGIPKLIKLGLLKNNFRFSPEPAISGG
jgi:hypothetical protein